MNWPLVPIKDVANVVTGKTPSKKMSEYFNGEIPFITPAELNKETCVYSSSQTLTVKGAEQITLIPKNSVMVCCIGSLGKTAIAGKELATNQQINSVIFNGDLVYSKYGFYALNTLKQQMKVLAPSTTVAIINKSKFESLKIPLPPLKEQKRIATILDKADNLRRKRNQAIQLANQFLRSVFLDMFGDPVTNPYGWDEFVLKDIADIRAGVTKGKKIDLSTSVTLPYMRVANVQDGYLDLSTIQTITVSPKDAEKCRLEYGDILLTEGGDPDKLGRGYVWHNEIQDCIHQNHIFSVRIHDKNKVLPIFLSTLIGSQRGKRYFLKVGKQTTGIASINKTVLSQFEPIIPPIELQKKYLDIVDRVNLIKEKFQNENMKLFDSLSQKAFSGKL